MNFRDPRRTLTAGLALAFGLSATYQSVAADNQKVGVRLAKAPTRQVLAQIPPAPMPDLSGTPAAPGALTPIPQPDPVMSAPQSQVSPAPSAIAPAPAATQSGSTDARPPLGLFYGEQERLDMMNKDPAAFPAATAAPVGPMAPVMSGEVDRFGYAPPPGTLGQTYKRRSRLIDDKKHPRIGMVDVYLPENVDVTGLGLKTKWTGKCWRLESDPLLPGVPHIYEIKASWGEGTEPQYRTVRLIMGRVVDLEF